VPKFYIKASGFVSYKTEMIEAKTEEFALTFYKHAVAGGHVQKESEELDFDTCEEDCDEQTNELV